MIYSEGSKLSPFFLIQRVATKKTFTLFFRENSNLSAVLFVLDTTIFLRSLDNMPTTQFIRLTSNKTCG